MTVKKKSLVMIVLALVLLVGGYVYLNAGSFITGTAEKIASDALGVKVHIGSIDLSLSDKKVTVNTLEIGNPPGYSKPYAMTAGTIVIGLNTASKQLIDFNDIEVKDSVVNFEVNEQGINLDDLKKLANRKQQKESVGSEQVRVIIQHMVIDASVINPSITFLHRDIPSIHMPAMKFSGVGKDGGGVSGGDAIVQVISKYLSSIESTARASGILNDLPSLGDAQKTMGNAAGGLQKLFK